MRWSPWLWTFLFLLCVLTTTEAQTLTSSAGGQTITSNFSFSVNTTTRTVTATVVSNWTATSSYRPVAWISTLPDNRNAADNTVSAPTSSGSNSVTRTFTYPVGGTVRVNFGTYVYEAFGDNTKYQVRVDFKVFPTVDQPQTISVTPTSGTVRRGQPFPVTITGAQTVPVWGPNDDSFEAQGAVLTPSLVFQNIGIQTVTVHCPAGSGYSQSNTVSLTVTVSGYVLEVKLPANPGKYQIIYDVSQGGVELFSTVQLPGAAAVTRRFPVNDSTPATITPRVVGLTKDGAIWSESAGTVTTLDPIMISPTLITSDDEAVPGTEIEPVTPQTPKTPDKDKGVWSATDPSGTAAKDATVKEATDKVVAGLDAVNNTLKQINAKPNTVTVIGGTTDMSGTHTRLDTVNENLEKMLGDPDAVAEGVSTVGGWAGTAYGDANTDAKSGSDEVKAAILGAGLEASNPIPDRGSSPVMYNIGSVAGLSLKKNFNLDLNPMTSPMIPAWLHSALSWMKAIIAFTAIGMLWVDTSKKTRNAILSVCQVNRDGDTVVERVSIAYLQSLGSSGLGLGNIGTWAGFIGVVAARFAWFAIISGAFIVLVPAMIAILENVIFDDFLSYGSLLFSLSSEGGPFGQLIGMVLNLAPIWTLCACLIFRIGSETLISAGVIPLAVFLRLVKV